MKKLATKTRRHKTKKHEPQRTQRNDCIEKEKNTENAEKNKKSK